MRETVQSGRLGFLVSGLFENIFQNNFSRNILDYDPTRD
jgi:hypothetical protein